MVWTMSVKYHVETIQIRLQSYTAYSATMLHVNYATLQNSAIRVNG